MTQKTSLVAIALVLLLTTSVAPISTLAPQPPILDAPFSQQSPSVISDFLSMNSTGDSAVQAIDVHASGSWAACAVFNGTARPTTTLNSQISPRDSLGYDDILVFGGTTTMNISWSSYLRGSGDSNCRGITHFGQDQILVFGTFEDHIQVGSSTQYSSGDDDVFLGIYNTSAGGWTDVTSFGGTANDEIRDVSSLSSGFLAVGYSSSDLTSDYAQVFPSGSGDCRSHPCGYIVRYTSALEEQEGNLAVSDQINGIKLYQISSQNAQGTSVIVGEFKGNLTLTGSTITGIESVGGQDGVILEIDNSVEFTGINRIGGVGFDSAKSIERINSGGFLIGMEATGCYNTTRPYNAVYCSTYGGRDIVVFQIYNNLSVNHHASIGTSGSDQLRDISIHQATGTFSLTGQIDDQLSIGGASIGIAQGTDTAFFASFSLNSTGVHSAWAFSSSGSASSDGQGVSIKHISEGLLYWAGRTSPSGTTGTNFPSTNVPGGGSDAGFLALMDVDEDRDGVGSRYDICPVNADPLQENFDEDEKGDACDEDDDNDGILDINDGCPRNELRLWTSIPSEDLDQDGCKDDGPLNQGKGQDLDDDNDSLDDSNDLCPKGALNWNSSDRGLDHDSDGCRDADEDNDDDNDGVDDTIDICNPPLSMVNTGNGSWQDYDGDGCHDEEDPDIDNDNALNDDDDCLYSTTPGFNSNERNLDWDGDGCEDSTEDNDDDADNKMDALDDTCKPPGTQLGTASHWSDHDSDGCDDDLEDLDDDNDGVLDGNDSCPRGSLNWISNEVTDYDGDGCRDATGEDPDIDNDGVRNQDDQCTKSPPNTPDYDGDGCVQGEDLDLDGDGIDNDDDTCPEGELGWSAISGLEDHDGDGCRDASEDNDDDNDGVFDVEDNCEKGAVGWDSNNSDKDYDGDGCLDSNEDVDVDDDGILDVNENCTRSPLEPFPDYDNDGCDDRGEDLDDDNDGILDDMDKDNIDDTSCSKSPMNRSLLVDFDRDGCFGLEDKDADGDGIPDSNDQCTPPGFAIMWLSTPNTDHDGDGCKDNEEDDDDDNDGKGDNVDACVKGIVGWTSKNKNQDFDQDGCKDDEDLDDDSDNVDDALDRFPFDCRYSGDMDNDGKPNPSTIKECPFPGTIDLIVDLDTDGDNVADAHEEDCGYDSFNPESLPPEGYRTRDQGCQPSPIEQLLEQYFSQILVGIFILTGLIIIGGILSSNVGGDIVRGRGTKAGRDANSGQQIGGNNAEHHARQMNEDSSHNESNTNSTVSQVSPLNHVPSTPPPNVEELYNTLSGTDGMPTPQSGPPTAAPPLPNTELPEVGQMDNGSPTELKG